MIFNTRSSKTLPALSADAVFCFSHLKWDFVYQRPQHIMSRFAQSTPVFFIEEPMELDESPMLEVLERGSNVFKCVPTVPRGLSPEAADGITRGLIQGLISQSRARRYVSWFYSPMMIEWARDLKPSAIVYDCMDELSSFKGAPPELRQREAELFGMADLVFTGGHSLYNAKRRMHRAVYEFPSSIDFSHFFKARRFDKEMPDQAPIKRQRVGYAGVIDERLDLELLGAISELRPDLNFVMIGPVVKIDPADLPRKQNIHYLGGRHYDDLPEYMAGWDAAIMPFAMNESTKFISPTKTPEYLAAGLPVVSTPITDVVKPYGEMGLVQIGADAEQFVAGLDAALGANIEALRKKADAFLKHRSWDMTFAAMADLIDESIHRKSAPAKKLLPGHGYAAAAT